MATSYHEPFPELSVEAREIHRALTSLVEELEAVDWYHQRVDVTTDDGLKAILAHNRDEEIEHAAMALEWLRRRMPQFDEQLRTYLFTTAPVTEIEEKEETDEQGGQPAAPSGEAGLVDLGVGKGNKTQAQ